MAFSGISKSIETLMESALTSPSPKNGARLLEQFNRTRESVVLLLCTNCGQPVDIAVPEGLVHVSPSIACEKAAL